MLDMHNKTLEIFSWGKVLVILGMSPFVGWSYKIFLFITPVTRRRR